MDSALRPREIQSRIRAGQSLEEVARAAGVPAEQIEPYAAPVLAERGHAAWQALAASVRRRGEPSAHRHLRDAVDERLTAIGVDSDDVDWDAWRNEDRRWTVRARYTDDTEREATFRYDQAGRFSTAEDDEARWLIGELSRRPGEEADDDRTDELAIVRAISDDPDQVGRDLAPEAGRTAGGELEDSEPEAGADADDAARAESHELAQPIRLREDAEPPRDEEPLAPDAPVPADFADTAEPTPAGGHRSDAGPTSAASPQEIAEEVEAEIDSYGLVPDGRSELDVLYDMLGGLAEDSINIYAGLQDPVVDSGRTNRADDAQPESYEASWTVDSIEIFRDASDGDAPEGTDGERHGDHVTVTSETFTLRHTPHSPGSAEPATDPASTDPASTDAPSPEAPAADAPEVAAWVDAAADEPAATGQVEPRQDEPEQNEPEQTRVADVEDDQPDLSAGVDDAVVAGDDADLAPEVGDTVLTPQVDDQETADSRAAEADDEQARALRLGEPIPMPSTAENEPAEKASLAAEPAEGLPTENEPAKTDSLEAEPVETGPVETKPVEAQSAEKVSTHASAEAEPAAPDGDEVAGTASAGEPIVTPAPAQKAALEAAPGEGTAPDAEPEHRPGGRRRRDPEQPSLVESGDEPTRALPRKRKARKRASVPSWDEIMFGGPPPKA